MSLAVIGAGFGRTGTLSLKLALEQVGLGPCMHMMALRDNPDRLPHWEALARGEEVDWDQVFAGFRATVDWPAARFWRQLADHFPAAKVVLTARPAESWLQSVHKTIYPVMRDRAKSDDPRRRRTADMAYELIVNQTFDGRMADPDHAIAVYRAHNAEVERTIPADRLLTYDVTQGWGPLCDFLGLPAPETPFPRTNTTAEFKALIAGQEQGPQGG